MAHSGTLPVDMKTFFSFFTGRPFLIEFINPRVTRFNESFFADIQHEINSSTSDISVRDLQQVTK